MPISAETAEWICTRCGSTNRRLVPERTPETTDRCVHCLVWHVVTRTERGVRWDARLK